MVLNMKELKKETYKTQRTTATDNENKILKALLPNPKTFTELKNELKISHTGLSKILDRLESTESIKRMEYSKAYELTAKGNKIVKAIPIIQDSIEEILKGKHRYSNEMGKFRLGYKGINFDILNDIRVDPKLAKIFESIARDTFKELEAKIADIPDIVKDKSVLNGKMVLAITIDFEDMKKQFLNRNNKQWKKLEIEWKNEEKWSKLMENGDSK